MACSEQDKLTSPFETELLTKGIGKPDGMVPALGLINDREALTTLGLNGEGERALRNLEGDSRMERVILRGDGPASWGLSQPERPCEKGARGMNIPA